MKSTLPRFSSDRLSAVSRWNTLNASVNRELRMIWVAMLGPIYGGGVGAIKIFAHIIAGSVQNAPEHARAASSRT